MMSFRLATTLTALVCLILFPILLLAGQPYIATYGVTGDTASDFMARRASPALLGLAVMLWLARDAEDTPLRKAISAGVVATFAGIAATGVYEYLVATAHWLILVAAASEMLIAVVFFRFTRT